MKAIAVLFTILFCMMVFFGCTGEDLGTDPVRANTTNEAGQEEPPEEDDPEPGILDLEIEQQIIRDFGSAGGAFISRYYGTYNGCVAVRFEGWGLGFSYEIIAGSKFCLSGYLFEDIIIWKRDGDTGSGNFYTVREAYYMGMLTRDNVRSIAKLEIQQNDWPEIDPEFKRIFKEEGMEKVKQEYVNRFYKGQTPPVVWIERCTSFSTGTANSFVLLRIMDGNFRYTDTIEEITVAGSVFRFPRTFAPFFWSWTRGSAPESGNLYSLQEAYDAGLLTEAYFKDLAKRNKSEFWYWY